MPVWLWGVHDQAVSGSLACAGVIVSESILRNQIKVRSGGITSHSVHHLDKIEL